MILIVDYGMGNLRSIEKAVLRLGFQVQISKEIDDVNHAEKIILPGVGHFTEGMKNLNASDLLAPLKFNALSKHKPILGICLGMQLMTGFSEEGNLEGLGWIDARVSKFRFENKFWKVPHIGWNNFETHNRADLFKGIEPQEKFYFVHSYFTECSDPGDITTLTNYGEQQFVSSFQRDNIYGVQFHPEKSHGAGLKLLRNFLEL